MNFSRLKRFSYIILAFVLTSCDDFLVKKTVTVESLVGEIYYQPDESKITGILTYQIKNNQSESLDEIYMVCNEEIIVDYITYKGKVKRFEQLSAYGYGIYRISIPVLGSGDSGTIELSFSLTGPVEKDRFILNENKVFLDAKNIWVPVPFADDFKFDFELTVNTPANYYSILGGNIINETVDQTRSITWESGLMDVTQTGNLIIINQNRYRKDDVYCYNENETFSDLLLNYGSQSIDYLSDMVIDSPLTDLHIITQIFSDSNLDQAILGEIMGGTILLSPEYEDCLSGMTIDSLSETMPPVIPFNSELFLFSIVAHEISHIYTSIILTFEDEAQISYEPLTEFIASSVVSAYYPSFERAVILNNRFLLMNAYLNRGQSEFLWKYYFGLLSLNLAFENKTDERFNFLEVLIEKYQYTEISQSELISTLNWMNREIIRENDNVTNQSQIINYQFLDIWEDPALYNITLVQSNELTPGRYSRINTNYSALIQHDFPVDIFGELIILAEDDATTNAIVLKKGETTNINLPDDCSEAFFSSPFNETENLLADNYLFIKKNVYMELTESINQYYETSVITDERFQFNETNENEGIYINDSQWQTIQHDYEKSMLYGQSVNLEFDRYIEFNDKIYIYAFKEIDNIQYGYVLLEINVKDNLYIIEGILDPFI